MGTQRVRRAWAVASAAALSVVLTATAVAVPPPVPSPPPGCSPPTEGRVALWRAEASPEDSAGINHATTGGPTAAYRVGMIGEAFSLPGAGDHVVVPDAADLNLVGDLTIEAWVRIDDVNFGAPDAQGVGGDRVIAWKAGAEPTYGLWIEGDAVTAEAAPLGFISGDRAQESAVLRTAGLAWAKDTWYHVAVTRSGTAVRFYRDGQRIGDALTGQAGIASTESPLTLGAVVEGGVVYNPLKGALDETGLWSRALDESEIAAIHATGTRACEAPPPSPTPTPTPPDTTPPETSITGGTPNGQEVKPGMRPATYSFASDDPGARFECRAFDTTAQQSFDVDRLFWAPCQSPYTSALDTSRPSAYAFEVRAIDAAGNRDSTPARRGLIRHADPDVPAVDRKPDRCKMVAVGTVRGSKRALHPGCRLARIRKGRVPCLHAVTLKKARCRFTRRSGAWVHSRSKRGPRFALVGEPVSLGGKRRGRWIVAARRGAVGGGATTVECAKPPAPRAGASDTSGRVASGSELSMTCVVEDNLAAYNNIGPNGWKPLYNWADGEVCMRNHPDAQPHPDFPTLTRFLANGGACYTGLGAALNDPNGTERDSSGGYYQGTEYCHMVVSGGYEVPAAKRPATRSTPYPGSVQTSSYLLWRTVNYSLDIANSKPPSYDGEPVPPAEY